MKKIITFLLVLILTALLCSSLLFSCAQKKEPNPIVEITMMSGETIRMELYPDVAPLSVANFLKYVKDGFYDGMVFHRIIQGFMIQTGGFSKVEIEGNAYPLVKDATYPSIKGEFSSNKVKNDLKHTTGVVSMARTDDPDSASAGFFICSADAPHLDGEYAAFGKVTDEESLAVVLKLEKVQVQRSGYLLQEIDGKYYASPGKYVPVDPPQIKTVRVVTLDR